MITSFKRNEGTAPAVITEPVAPVTVVPDSSNEPDEGTLAMLPTMPLEGEFLPQDVVLPRINLVQSVGPLSELFAPGGVVYNKEITLSDGASPVSLTVMRIRKQYQEYVPYGGDESPRMFDTLDEVRAWLTPALRTGPLEIGIVGDFEPDAVIDAVAATLGALPARGERTDDSALRQVAFPSTPFNRSYEIDSKLQKGLALFYWPTTDGRDAHTSRRLGLLASVVTDRMRLRLREEMGGTYSPSARSVASDTFPGYGYLTSGIDIDPAAADKIAEAVTALSAELHQQGVTEDELTRAKRPALTSIRESARSNAYWLNSVLARAQERPEVL